MCVKVIIVLSQIPESHWIPVICLEWMISVSVDENIINCCLTLVRNSSSSGDIWINIINCSLTSVRNSSGGGGI